MDSTIFERGRAEDKCVDFKSNIIQTNLEDCYIMHSYYAYSTPMHAVHGGFLVCVFLSS